MLNITFLTSLFLYYCNINWRNKPFLVIAPLKCNCSSIAMDGWPIPWHKFLLAFLKFKQKMTPNQPSKSYLSKKYLSPYTQLNWPPIQQIHMPSMWHLGFPSSNCLSNIIYLRTYFQIFPIHSLKKYFPNKASHNCRICSIKDQIWTKTINENNPKPTL